MTGLSEKSGARGWQRRQLTDGTQKGLYHAHSYYDIPVFDAGSRYIAAHRMDFAERDPGPDDRIEVGIVDCEVTRGFERLGTSVAWSWQQGPMAQWRRDAPVLCWNDRVGGRFITRLVDITTKQETTLARPTYAVAAAGTFVLSLNMARLDALRPGYGYAGGTDARLDERQPSDDGVWRIDTASGNERLLLSLADAVDCLARTLSRRERLRHRLRRFHYWFNHVKISPDDSRFTVKLRFKTLGGGWDDTQGVSLTCDTDGGDVRVLAGATSHVIWRDPFQLYMWQRDGFYLYADTAPIGTLQRRIGAGLVEANAHLRYLPDAPGKFVFDTPYRDDVDVYIHDERSRTTQWLDRFSHHRPRNGPYRCDVHPCPSPDGRRIAVTSVEDGGRQLYLLTRDEMATAADRAAAP